MTDLTDRMRTCAAHLATASIVPNPAAIDDAAALLNEAADLLESAAETLERGAYDLRDGGYLRSATILKEEAENLKGEPMEIIPPVTAPMGTWIAPGGPLPGLKHSGTVSMRTCPKCDSRVQKTARRVGDALMLNCPVCGHQWTWRKGA